MWGGDAEANDIAKERLEQNIFSRYVVPSHAQCNDEYTDGKHLEFKIAPDDVASAQAGTYRTPINIVFEPGVR